MSIQAIVETPFSYYKNCFACDDPVKYSKIFCDKIKRQFNFELPCDIDKQFFCEDLLASVKFDIMDVALDTSKELSHRLVTCLHLPINFDDIKITLPFIADKRGFFVISTNKFHDAIEKIEPILQKKFPDNFEKYKDELDVYRQAITISEREKMPIFWSY